MAKLTLHGHTGIRSNAALVECLKRARRVAALTGAGISAESGIPTFRDARSGLWAKYNPEDLATPDAFCRDPKLVWEWYQWRRGQVAKAEPNPGHLALAALERRFPEFTLITQNVDGLHRRAGNRNVLELHGNITHSKCFEQHHRVETWADDGSIPPRCPRCGGRLRPDVVWFGEMLPERVLERATDAARDCDLFLSVGTSTLVYPAAGLPEIALQAGAVVVEVNAEPTPLSGRARWSLRGPASQVLPALLEALAP